MVIDELLGRLHGVTRTSNGWDALCPAHGDQRPSLGVAVGSDGRILLKCRAGCSIESIVSALGLSMKDLFTGPPPASPGRARIVATYDYKDANGKLKYQNVRYEPKAFKVRKPDGNNGWTWTLRGVKRTPYRLPELRGHDHVYITEGEKDADRLWREGLPATCSAGGAESWTEDVSKQLAVIGVLTATVLPDCDPAGDKYARTVYRCNEAAGIVTKVAALPGDRSGYDVSDYLATYSVGELLELEEAAPEGAPPEPVSNEPTLPEVEPCTIDEANAVFRRWLGPAYDLAAMHATAAAAAVEWLDGDPLWLMLLSGPGFAKTETVQAAAGAGAVVTSSITSEGALLSGTSKKERTKDATGGLLVKMGPRGILVIKDFTTILSMNNVVRTTVLAALREVYDGYWERNLGTNGGMTLTWKGRLVVIAAVTSAWDQHQAVISSLGDRFALLRVDSTVGREEAGMQAMANISHETEMRAELAAAIGGLIANINKSVSPTLSEDERQELLKAADLTTRCRTAVEFDYHGNVLEAHQPEAPTRFAKELAQLMRGAIAIGLSRADAMSLAIRCARDSMPPMRLLILEYLAVNSSGAKLSEIWRGLDLPRTSIKRHLDALHQLKLVTMREEILPPKDGEAQPPKSEFRYTLPDDVDPRVVGWGTYEDLGM